MQPITDSEEIASLECFCHNRESGRELQGVSCGTTCGKTLVLQDPQARFFVKQKWAAGKIFDSNKMRRRQGLILFEVDQFCFPCLNNTV